MNLTVTEYEFLAIDGEGEHCDLIGNISTRHCTRLGGPGSIELQPGTKIVRVATDTLAFVDPTGGTNGDLVPAGSVSFFDVVGATALVVATS
jgi:hypothetical protein